MGYLFIVFVDIIFFFFFFFFFHLLCDLSFTRGCNFLTRLAKHSIQKFDINTRNIHKGIFSCNLWWFVGICHIATGRVWCVFSLSSFCLLVDDKFGKKYDLFSLLGTGQNLLGAWDRCKRPWVGHFFFIALKHVADTFFLQYPAMGWILFSTTLKPIRRYLQKKKCSCSCIFHWNSRQWLKCSCTYRSELEKNSDTARSQYSEYYES